MAEPQFRPHDNVRCGPILKVSGWNHEIFLKSLEINAQSQAK